MTLEQTLNAMPAAGQLHVLLSMVREMSNGTDQTLQAIAAHTTSLGAQAIVVGGVAVIHHGYRRTTADRDLLVSYRDVAALADRLMEDEVWERLEIRQYAFLYRPTGIQVDFLVTRDLMTLGLPYYFPDVDEIETSHEVAGLPVIGLHDLMFFKLIAGRMQDLADIMELCKRHLDEVDADRVLDRLQPEDEPIRRKFLEILKNAPVELENERRLGQQDE